MFTIKRVNRAIMSAGMVEIELVKGCGYFYFVGDNVDTSSYGVYVYTLNELTIERWVEEAKSRYNKDS